MPDHKNEIPTHNLDSPVNGRQRGRYFGAAYDDIKNRRSGLSIPIFSRQIDLNGQEPTAQNFQ